MHNVLRCLSWFVVVCRGLFWFVVVCCCFLWFVVVCCGLLLFVVVFCGRLWYGMGSFGLLSLVVASSGRMRFVVWNCGLSRNVAAWSVTPWFVLVFRRTLRCVVGEFSNVMEGCCAFRFVLGAFRFASRSCGSIWGFFRFAVGIAVWRGV